MSLLFTVLSFIVAIGVLVTVHEFGHFWVARKLGVKVLRFSVGFGKALWSKAFPFKTHKANKRNSFASSTPAVDADAVYVAWGNQTELKVTALSHEGKQLWQGNFGKVIGNHGFGVSPIVHEDLVVLPNDIEKGGGFLLAIDRAASHDETYPIGGASGTYLVPD